MTQRKCKSCKKIVVENWEKWFAENKETVWLQCPYCFEMERIR